MRKTLILFSLCFFLNGISKASNDTKPGAKLNAQKNYQGFIENKGQVTDQFGHTRQDILFSGTDGELVYHIKKTGLSYQLSRNESSEESMDPKNGMTLKNSFTTSIYRIDIKWKDSKKDFHCIKDAALTGEQNFYNEKSELNLNHIKKFKGFTLKGLYQGIDLHYYQKEGKLKYDYMVAPYSDYKKIQLEVKGADIELLQNGSIILKTPFRNIEEAAPVVFQNGKQLPSKWMIDENVISFSISGYDKSQELIIDPGVRIWGTYYGGTNDEQILGSATDAAGNVYVTGYAQSNNGTSIATIGSFKQTISGGRDAFLAKFNSSGVRLWATYYGGTATGGDMANSCAVDPSGNIYICGNSASTSGISSVGSHQGAFGGGSTDAFLAKFNSAGVRQWATYYGGTGVDYGYSCAADASGNIYLAGSTTSTIGIATVGSFTDTFSGGLFDAYIVKFNSAGVRQWGTYYGGSGIDHAYACTTDLNGNVFIGGHTQTATGTLIASAGSHQQTFGGTNDAYIAKFNSSGLRLWGTYYGGSGYDQTSSCICDASGNIYFSGHTNSSTGTIIATAGSHQQNHGGGTNDAFLVKLDAAGIRQWGTYYGGNGNIDYGTCCNLDAAGNIFMSGRTESGTGTVIATAPGHQYIYAGSSDAYIVKFDNTGIRKWGTYYGDVSTDAGCASVCDGMGNVYLAGYTGSSSGTAIATAGSHQQNTGGTIDGFLVKFVDCIDIVTSIASYSNALCYGGASGSATINAVGGNGFTYTWSPIGGNAAIASSLSIGSYSCAITNSCGSTSSISLFISQPPSLSLTATSLDSLICAGDDATLTASGSGGTGNISYHWTTGETTQSIVVTPNTSETYYLTIYDANNCAFTSFVSQYVETCVGLNEKNQDLSLISIYPNPSSGNFIIKIRGNYDNSSIEIYNSIGMLLIRKKTINDHESIDLTEQSDGIYLLKVINQESTSTYRIIKN